MPKLATGFASRCCGNLRPLQKILLLDFQKSWISHLKQLPKENTSRICMGVWTFGFRSILSGNSWRRRRMAIRMSLHWRNIQGNLWDFSLSERLQVWVQGWLFSGFSNIKKVQKYIESKHIIEKSTSGSTTQELIHSWFKKCRNGHTRCNAALNEPPWLPSRLLEIEPSGRLGYFRIIETNSHSIDTSYIALSHCWGTK